MVKRNPQTDQLEALLLNYGNTAKEHGQPITSETVYEIGSITKVFTGILLAQAVSFGIDQLERSYRRKICRTVCILPHIKTSQSEWLIWQHTVPVFRVNLGPIILPIFTSG